MAVTGRKADSISISSDEDIGLYCVPCHLDGPLVAALGYCVDCREHLCDACYRSHRKPAPSRDHHMLNRSQMPKSQTSKNLDTVDAGIDMCTKHKEKPLEYFCVKHNAILCHVCLNIHHRLCHVEYIPDISEKMVESKGQKCFEERLQILIHKCTHTKSSAERNREKLIKIGKELDEEVEKFRTDFNKLIDEIKLKAENYKVKNENWLCTISDSSTKLEKRLVLLQDRLKEQKDSKKFNQMFSEVKKAQLELEEHETYVAKLAKGTEIVEIKFVPDQYIKKAVSGSSRLIGVLVPRVNTFGKSRRKDTLSMQSNSDASRCQVSGMAFCPSIVIAVADCSNRVVKLIDTSTTKVRSSMVLPSSPSDVTYLAKNQLAVTLPETGSILILSSLPVFAIDRVISVNGICQGVAYGRGKLVVSFSKPGKVQIISLEGNPLVTVGGDELSDHISYINIPSHENHILLSDFIKNNVTRIDWNGKVTGVYQDEQLKRPVGMASIDDGSFFVCSSGTNEVHHVSAGMQKLSTVLTKSDAISGPWDVCFHTEANQLFVCCQDSNLLKCFTLENK